MSIAHPPDPPELNKYMDKKLTFKLNGKRTVTGILREFDPFMNVVVDEAVEIGKDKTQKFLGIVNVIDDIVSKKPVNGHPSPVYDSDENATDELNNDNLLNNSMQDHTYHSFPELATETDAVDETSITESTDKPHKCHICGVSFSRQSSLKGHIRFHIEGPDLMLRNTSITVETPVDEKNQNSLTCDYKNHKSPSSTIPNGIDTVEKEIEVEEDESKPYKCFICPKKFARQTGLASHITLHEINTRKKSNDDSEKRFSGIESKIFKEVTENSDSNSELVDGNIIHEHKCHLCDRSFPQVRGLRQHLLFHRKNTEAVAIANHVKTSSIPSDIIYEEVSNRKYTCFTKNHRHDEITKLYKCNVCQKCFCDIGNLKRHLARNHHDESTDAENEVSEDDLKLRKRGPPTSDICSDTISSKRHKPSTPVPIIFVGLYKCGICNESFDEIDSLRDHVAVHLNDLFRCETCSRAFTAKDALESHICEILQTSPDEELVCVVCDLKFRNNSTLKRHMNCHRRVEEEIIMKVSSSGRRIKDPRSYREDDWNTPVVKRIAKANPPEDMQIEKASEGATVCDCCNRTFPNEKARKIHLYYNSRNTKDKGISPISKPEPAEPEKSPVVLEQKTELNQKNSNLDSLKCSCCDKLFTSIRALTNHVSGVSDNTTEETSAADNHSMTNMIKCDRCDRFFFGIRALKMHINDHIRKVVPPQEPSSLDDSMEDLEIDNETIESHNHEEPQPEEVSQADESQDETIPHCEICNRTFATNRALGIHKSHHLDHLVCCGKTFDSQRALNIHKFHHPNTASDDPLNCACCDKIFATKQTLKAHLRRKAKLDENVEEEEEEEEEDEAAEEEESDDDVFVSLACDICDKTFKSRQGLKKHEKTHDEENDDNEFECPKCGKIFSTLRSLGVHKAFHTKSEKHHDAEAEAVAEANGKVYFELANGLFKCRFCDQTFDNVKAVCRHYSKHKKIVESESLENNRHGKHKKIVESENLEYKCTICDRSFASGNALGGHMNSHKDIYKVKENEFKCAECDRTYASGKSLAAHMKCHEVAEESGESEEESEEVQCSQCEKTFCNKKAIAGHMSIHKKKPNESWRDKCERSFSSAKSSKAHKFKKDVQTEPIDSTNDEIEPVEKSKNEPEIKIYQCKYCDRSFNNMFGFAGHCSAHKKKSRGQEKPVQLSCHLKNAAESDDSKTEAKCDICELNFDDLKSLAKHVEEHKADGETDKMFKCPSCPQEFEKESGLRRHSTVHKNDVQNLNDTTSESLADQTVISSVDHSMTQSDMIDRTEVESFMELDSNDRLMNQTDIIANVEVESVVDQSTDVTLNETDKTIEQTSQKSPQSQASREHQCEICFKQLDSQKALKRHNMWHKFNDFAEEPESSEINIICTKCDKIFADDQALQVHLTFHGTLATASMSDLTNMIVKCDRCPELFDCIRSLKKHSLEVHDKVLNHGKFQCNFCDKKFHKINGLRMHLRVHRVDEELPDDVMPFECISCEKCFRLKDDLLEHVKTHVDGDLDDEAMQ